MRRTGLVLITGALAAVASVPAAEAAVVKGRLGDPLPPRARAMASVRAVDVERGVVVAARQLRTKAFSLRVTPTRGLALFATTSPVRAGAGRRVDRLATVLRVGANGRKGVALRLRPRPKGRGTRAAAAARPGFVDVPHPAIWVQHFDVSGAAKEFSVLRKGLADMLITDLAGIDCEKGPVVVEREKLDAILDEIERQQRKGFDPRTRVRPGRIVEHNATVGGTVTSSGDTITLTATYTDVRSGRTATATVSGPRGGFFELQQELARKLEEIVCAPDRVRVSFSSTGRLVWSMHEVHRPDPEIPQWEDVYDERVDLAWTGVDTMAAYTVAPDRLPFVTHGLTGFGGTATEDAHMEDWEHHRDGPPTREMVADEHCAGVVTPWQEPFAAAMQNRAVVEVLRAPGLDTVEVRWRPAMYGFIGGVRGRCDRHAEYRTGGASDTVREDWELHLHRYGGDYQEGGELPRGETEAGILVARFSAAELTALKAGTAVTKGATPLGPLPVDCHQSGPPADGTCTRGLEHDVTITATREP